MHAFFFALFLYKKITKALIKLKIGLIDGILREGGFAMKTSKKIMMLGLSLIMFQSISFADNQIPNQVFTDLSVVIDSIEGTTMDQTNTTTPVGGLDQKISYSRDRNSAKMTWALFGLDATYISEESREIRIELSDDAMARNGLVNPMTYFEEKNDRLVESIGYESSGSKNEIVILLRDNVDYQLQVTNTNLEINFTKKISATPKIVIDPGHGGKDPGAYSQTTQTQEKTIALRTGLLLRDILLSKGYDVTMTRDSDWYPELKDRSKLANEMDADIFVSIHYNSATASASGIETFAYFTEDNKELAESIQKELISYTGANNRGVKNGNKLIVLNTTKVPAALLELGFLSNPTEAKRILENDYQNTLAQAIASGIDKYFGR